MMDDESLIIHNHGYRPTQSSTHAIVGCLSPFLGNTERFVDVGCGTGRIIAYMVDNGYRGPITGIEIDPTVAEHARKRFSGNDQVEIVTADIFDWMPEDAGLFYLFRPFCYSMAIRFRDKVARYGEGTTIVYNGPEGVVFLMDEEQRWEVVPIIGTLMVPLSPGHTGPSDVWSVHQKSIYLARRGPS